MKLNLGSAYAPLAGWTNLDANPNAPADIIGTAWPLPPEIKDGTVVELRAVDVLEHLSYRDTADVLSDWYYAMDKGGQLFVQVPDAETCMEWFWNEPHKLIERIPAGLPTTPMVGLAWRLLGGHADGEMIRSGDDWRLNAHYALFSEDSLRHALEDVGFVVQRIDRNGHPNLQAWCIRP